MDKIDVLELLDEQSVTTKEKDYKDWREALNDIKAANNNFDINTMCEVCIKQQYEIGLKDALGRHQPITIQCTGLNTYKNKVISEHGEEVYKTLEGILSKEQKDQAEQIENSMDWMAGNIKDSKLFNSRPHQVMINSCSAKKKVLRMGRRCIEANTKVLGPKKGYSIKHLFNMFRKYKEMPYIYAYDDETGKLVLTNKYLIMPNGRVDTVKITLSNGHSVIATQNHPLLVYRDKQFNYVPIGELDIEYDKVLLDNNEILSIRSIENVGKRSTYHLSVIKYETFLTTGGFIHHNTGKTYAMSVGMLHRMLTNKNYKVLMVAPMATMIDEVVEQIKKFCDAMEVNPIESSSQSPIAFIEFNTGSTFKGVTAGASGAKGTRGKAADLLYIDECFPGRTKIKMWDGTTKSIEDIETGDRVLSFDERTQKLVAKNVLEVRCTGKKDVYTFETVSGKKLHTTANHPVWSRDGWKEAYEARSLATTETRTGDFFFESVVGSRFKATEKVYNLEVEDTHTYIADGFIVHNCDFLNPKDLNAILGILMDNANTEFWASSTPIGEGNLYQLSQDPSFKEFHFPSYVIPHYSDKIDEDLRRQMTEVGYEQEVLANFGASEEGVFQIPFIEKSIIKEQLILTERYILENRPDFILFMGVDWNHDKVGTRIVILAYHKPTGRFVVVCKERVALAGWTQLLAVQKIVDLNRIYDVDHIYVDEGFGTSQASMLRQFSREQYGKVPANHPDLKLTDVVAVNFSATLNLRDPVTGEELKKQTKQYMVEHAAKLLTQGVLILREEEDSAIIAQMKNYIVKSISARGLKTFTYKDPQVADHDLDAYMLALHGFHQEYSEFNTYGPIVGIGSLLSRNNDGSLHMNELGMDPVEVYSASSNMVINTRKSILNNKFSSSSRHSPFKGRKKW